MRDSPDAVCIYIPLMKDLGMSWLDIKNTPRRELEGILAAFSEYNTLHSFDGYNDNDISQMAKDKPEIRAAYVKYVESNRNLREKLGQEAKSKSFKDLLG